MGCRHATDARDPTSTAACRLPSVRDDVKSLKPPPSRTELISSIFHSCDTDDDDHLSCLELMRFASLVDYLDSSESWTKKYDWMCEQFGWVPEVGADICAFTRLVDNDDAAGYFRTTSELRRLLRELLELNKLDVSDDSDEESSGSCSSAPLSAHPSSPARALKRRKTKQKKRIVSALTKMPKNSALEVVEKLLCHGVDTLLQEEDGEVSALQFAAEACGLLEGGDSDLRQLISDFRSSGCSSSSQLLRNDSDSEGNEEAAAKPGMRRKPKKVGHQEGPLPKKVAAKRKLPAKACSMPPDLDSEQQQQSPKPCPLKQLQDALTASGTEKSKSSGDISPRGVDRETSQEDHVHDRASAASAPLAEMASPEDGASLSPDGTQEPAIRSLVPQMFAGKADLIVEQDTRTLDVGKALSVPADAQDGCLRSRKPLLRRHHQARAPMRGLFKRKLLKDASVGKEDAVNESDEQQQTEHFLFHTSSTLPAVRSCASEDLACDSDHSNDGQELHKTAKTKSRKSGRPPKTVQVQKSRRSRLLSAVR